MLSEEEEMILKNEMDNEEATPQVGEGNYQVLLIVITWTLI